MPPEGIAMDEFKQALYTSMSNYIDYICECRNQPKLAGEVIDRISDTVRQVEDIRAEQQEHFIVLILDGQNRILEKFDASKGTSNASLAHPREIFKRAIVDNATGIICLHNHPSGLLEPSPEDIQTTKRIKQAGELLGIKLYDHIIVTANDYRSILSTPEWYMSNNQ